MKIIATFCLSVLVTGVLTLAAASWTVAAFRYLSGTKASLFSKPSPRTPSQWGVVDLLLSAFAYVFLTLLAGAAIRLFWQPHIEGTTEAVTASPPTPLLFLAVGAAQILSVIIGTKLLRFRAGSAVVKSLWSLREFRSDLILALYAFGLVIVPVFLIQAGLTQLIKYEHPAITPFRESKDWAFFAGAAFSAVIAAPLGEEYFFRGLLQGWLERFAILGAASWEDLIAPKPGQEFTTTSETTSEEPSDELASVQSDNPYAFQTQGSEVRAVSASVAVGYRPNEIPHWPLWVVSGVFAMMHMSQGPAPVPLFFFSLAMGYVFRYTGRILPCLMMHMMLNGLSMAMLALSVFVPQPQ